MSYEYLKSCFHTAVESSLFSSWIDLSFKYSIFLGYYELPLQASV